MGEVARKRTPIGDQEAAEVIAGALERAGEPLSAAPLLLAHMWIEARHGQSVQNHSWGNITGPSSAGDFWRPPWFSVDESSSERDRHLHEEMKANRAPSQFRAYPSFEAGADDYIAFLQKTKFRPLLDAAIEGDVAAFVRALETTGYSPGFDEPATLDTMERLTTEAKGFFPEVAPSQPTRPKRALAGLATLFAGLGAVFFSLADVLEAEMHEEENSHG